MLPMNDSKRAMVRSYGIMLGRILLGLTFVYSGIGILMGGVASTVTFYDALGIPMAGIIVYVVLAIKLGAGVALMVGFRTGCAATLLILFTLAATAIAHMNYEDMNLYKNLSIVGGLLYALAYGPGDGWKMKQ